MRGCLILLFSMMLVMCCKVQHNVSEFEYGDKGDTMLVTMFGSYSARQFDSLCNADTLPTDLDEWQTFAAKDYETRRSITVWFYMKENGKFETVYKVESFKDGDSMRITKREIK